MRLSEPAKLACLAVSVSAFAVLALLLPIPFENRATGAMGDLVHAPLFGLLTLGVLHGWQAFRPATTLAPMQIYRGIIAAASLFACGVIMEIIQNTTGRSASVKDAIANGLGATAAAIWFIASRSSESHPELATMRRSMRATSVALIGLAWIFPAMSLLEVSKVYRGFPVLCSFESKYELQFWHFDDCRANWTRENATDGEHAMQIRFAAKPHPAATLIDPRSDWTTMKWLEMDVILDADHKSESADLQVKVIDNDHEDYFGDTFRRQWSLVPGKLLHLKISLRDVQRGPDTRQLDLSRIKYVSLQILNSNVPTTIRVDSIRLSK